MPQSLGARRASAGGEDFPAAERVTLVMNHLNAHVDVSMYKAFFAAPGAQVA